MQFVCVAGAEGSYSIGVGTGHMNSRISFHSVQNIRSRRTRRVQDGVDEKCENLRGRDNLKDIG
jgi:hypothetical protein